LNEAKKFDDLGLGTPDADATVYHSDSPSSLHFGILGIVYRCKRTRRYGLASRCRGEEVATHTCDSSAQADLTLRRDEKRGEGAHGHLENATRSWSHRARDNLGEEKKREKRHVKKSDRLSDSIRDRIHGYTRIRAPGTRVFPLPRSHIHTHAGTQLSSCHARERQLAGAPAISSRDGHDTTCRVRPTAAGVVVIPPGRRRAGRSLHDDDRLASGCRAYLNSHWPCVSSGEHPRWHRRLSASSAAIRRGWLVAKARGPAPALACLLETRRGRHRSAPLTTVDETAPKWRTANGRSRDPTRRFNDVSRAAR